MDIDELLVDQIMKIQDDDNFIIGIMAFLQTDRAKVEQQKLRKNTNE